MNLFSLLLACAVCMGGDDAKVGPAMNSAIFLLIGCISAMLALVVGVAITIARRARAYAAEQETTYQDLSLKKF